MTLALRYAVRSDVGLLREGNEDSAYAGPHLLAIADGMGGHAAGEVASAVAISALAGLDEEVPVSNLLELLSAAVANANATLHEMSTQDPSVEGMGTTLTAMLWSGSTVALCHIGDSRAYLLRDGEFYQITHDHTLVQSLVDDGRLSPEQAHTHPQRSLVMRALQSSTDAEPDLSVREAVVGDRYLLCSDGLSDVVSEQTMQQHAGEVHRPRGSRQPADRSRDPRRRPGQYHLHRGRCGGHGDRAGCRHQCVRHRRRGVQRRRAAAAAQRQPRGPREPAHPSGPADSRPSAGRGRPGDHRRPAGRHQQVRRDDAAGRRTATATQPGMVAGLEPEPDDTDTTEASPGRRRWPLVTSILAVLVIVIAAGGYAAWRYTQNQYYVGTDGHQVIIYRGVDENVAGLSLSSVYQRTGIPIAHVTANDLPQVKTTITADSLVGAKQIVVNIQHAYTCQLATAALAKWEANKPAPVKPKRVRGKVIVPKAKPYPPKPAVPSYCAGQQGAPA